MSYILDALKRAERERGIARVPTIATVHDFHPPSRTQPWLSIGILVMAAAAILWFFMSFQKNAGTTPANTPAVTAEQSQSEPNAGSHSISEADSPIQSAPLSGAPARAEKSRVVKQEPVVTEPYPTRSAAVADSNPGVKQPALPISDAVSNDRVEKTAASAPATLREAVAKMIMTMHVFGENKTDRLVFINGKKCVEGDYVDGRFLLESITSEGALLSYEGQRALLKPELK